MTVTMAPTLNKKAAPDHEPIPERYVKRPLRDLFDFRGRLCTQPRRNRRLACGFSFNPAANSKIRSIHIARGNRRSNSVIGTFVRNIHQEDFHYLI